MIKKELEANKNIANARLQSYMKNKDSLEKTKEVKEYLETIEKIKKEQTLQKFLKQLEIGEDGTIFSPYKEYYDRFCQNTHFGLSRTLEYAFDLMNQTEKDDERFDSNYFVLSFSDFSLYLENAKNILTDMNHVTGDRLFNNDYGYVIHENPKNYSVINFQAILPLTYETLRQSYNISNIYTNGIEFIIPKEKANFLGKDHFLTPREKEAFYGEKAKQILGLLPKQEKIKKKLNI